VDEQRSISEDVFECPLGSESLPFDHHRLFTFFENVLEDKDERGWCSVPADSSRVHAQSGLGLAEKSHKLLSIKIANAPDHKDGAVLESP